jgi:hypothetical protein
MTHVMAAPATPVAYMKYKLGPNGTCMDFVCFGKCTDPSCSYKHNAAIRLTPGQTQRAVPHLKVAYDAYKAAHT